MYEDSKENEYVELFCVQCKIEQKISCMCYYYIQFNVYQVKSVKFFSVVYQKSRISMTFSTPAFPHAPKPYI